LQNRLFFTNLLKHFRGIFIFKFSRIYGTVHSSLQPPLLAYQHLNANRATAYWDYVYLLSRNQQKIVCRCLVALSLRQLLIPSLLLPRLEQTVIVIDLDSILLFWLGDRMEYLSTWCLNFTDLSFGEWFYNYKEINSLYVRLDNNTQLIWLLKIDIYYLYISSHMDCQL
jgi:hypothetical protein